MIDTTEYLRKIMPSREEVDRFISRVVVPDDRVRNNDGWTYDSGLGWVLKNSYRDDGVDKSRTFYRYEQSGARVRINAADVPCRIHAYGDSFTHCDQVNDGETWEEYLAGHLREPVMNFGVGGYGVYQAYLRMQKTEAHDRAQYVILNIWHDDHLRSLDTWRAIRFGFRTPCGFTLPYLSVNGGKVEEKPNICPTADDLYKLTDPGFVVETFRNDPALADMCRPRENVGAGGVYFRPTTMSQAHIDSCLLASRWIVEQAERACAERKQQLIVILSHGGEIVRDTLEGKPRWDASFVEWVKKRPVPVLDIMDAHVAEFATMKLSPRDYINRYYIGHYSPAGNFFMASALRPFIVSLLDPRPAPYP